MELEASVAKRQDVSQSSYRITAQYIDANEVQQLWTKWEDRVCTSSLPKYCFEMNPIELMATPQKKRWTRKRFEDELDLSYVIDGIQVRGKEETIVRNV